MYYRYRVESTVAPSIWFSGVSAKSTKNLSAMINPHAGTPKKDTQNQIPIATARSDEAAYPDTP